MTAQVTWPYPCPQPHEHDLVRVPSRIADSYLPILRGGKAQNGRIGLKKRRNCRHCPGCCHDPLPLRGGGEGATKFYLEVAMISALDQAGNERYQRIAGASPDVGHVNRLTIFVYFCSF